MCGLSVIIGNKTNITKMTDVLHHIDNNNISINNHITSNDKI